MFDWDKMRPARSAEELYNTPKKRKIIVLGVPTKEEDTKNER